MSKLSDFVNQSSGLGTIEGSVITEAELLEAIKLAGQKQTSLWV